MKRILFITQNMNMNGANKSLMNLLKVIDKEVYEIDLFAFLYEGILRDEIPDGINIIKENKYMSYFADSMQNVWKKGNIIGKGIRGISAIEKKVSGCTTDPHTKFLLWKFVPVFDKEYDVAIAWNEGACHKFLVEKITASIKIGWCHIDDEAYPYHYNLQKKYFPKLDYICTVSNKCKKALLNRYDISDSKVKIIRNIMPIKTIQEASSEKFSLFDSNQINILTITRNENFKRNTDAIQAAQLLKEKGVKIHWWILGGGFTDEQYNSTCEYLTFLRPVKNPYVYLRNCDIYVQTSRREAWGMAVNEAKILRKPIVVSNVEVFKEQIENELNGLVYDCSVNDLVEQILRFINDQELRKRIQNRLSEKEWSNIEDLNILYSLIEGK